MAGPSWFIFIFRRDIISLQHINHHQRKNYKRKRKTEKKQQRSSIHSYTYLCTTTSTQQSFHSLKKFKFPPTPFKCIVRHYHSQLLQQTVQLPVTRWEAAPNPCGAKGDKRSLPAGLVARVEMVQHLGQRRVDGHGRVFGHLHPTRRARVHLGLERPLDARLKINTQVFYLQGC